ncbi:MAG: hypothetical protein WD335_00835 [Candidatus Paceibacterota bacterium]
MKHKISTTNKGKKESQGVKARTIIYAGLRINVKESVKLEDITKALESDENDLRWGEPMYSQLSGKIPIVLVPLQFTDEELEQTESKSVSEHLKRLKDIKTDWMEQQLTKTAVRLMARRVPGVGLIFPITDSHTTSPAN